MEPTRQSLYVYTAQRREFMTKTLIITFAFMALTVIQWLLIWKCVEVGSFLQQMLVASMLCIVIVMVLIILFILIGEIRFESPWNYIVAFLIVEGLTYGLSVVISSVHEEDLYAVWLAAGVTLALFCILFIVALHIPYDLTVSTGSIIAFYYVVFICMCFTLMVVALAVSLDGLMLFAVYMVVLVCLCIMYHVQTTHGAYSAEIRLNDYVMAAILFYYELIILFTSLLLLYMVICKITTGMPFGHGSESFYEPVDDENDSILDELHKRENNIFQTPPGEERPIGETTEPGMNA